MHYLILLIIPTIFCQQQTWNYFAGGNDWHSIWETCSSTQGQQSPIDIHYENVTTVTQAILYFDFFAKNVVTKIENNGQFIKSDFPWMGVEMNDQTGEVRKAQCFTLAFHAPSEHVIEGNRFDMEMQITCEDVINNGKFINIALLFEGERFEDCTLMDNFAATAINLKHPGTKAKVSLDFEQAFKEALEKNQIQEYYTYTGSFTSPPCHHSVEWAILAKPIKMSVQSLSNFQALWAGDKDFAGGSGNYRNLQLFHDTTKLLKGGLQQDLKPVNLVNQINNELNKENTESDEYYQNKINKYLDRLGSQRKADEYQIKVEKKAKYLQECINQLKKQLQQEMQSGDGSNTEHLSEKLKEKEVELEEFLEKCSEYDPNCFFQLFFNGFQANCDVDIPTESKTVEEDLNDNDNDDSVSKLNQEDQEAIKKDSQELSNINDGPKTKEQVLVTHDGQEIEMEVPDELEFLQIRKKNFKKFRKNRQSN